MFGFLFGFPFLLTGFFLYFLPTIIAMARGKTNLAPILLVNLFLGWSVVGWIVAMVWAVSIERVDQVRMAQPAPPSRFCNRCGKYVEVGSHFCANCGVAFS
jgi:Superinfection immunity protein